MLLESAAFAPLVALAREGYGIAVVPSDAHALDGDVRLVPVVHRGASVGRWP